jgi:hypothetical protein
MQRNSMTCRGYDSRTVKISKGVKLSAAGILDAHRRGAFIRSYVLVAREAAQNRSSRRERQR